MSVWSPPRPAACRGPDTTTLPAVTTVASHVVPVCLSIAGSDSGGGAGIQADLKAFAACGVHGTTAITAITAQNTVAVTGVWPVAPEAIVAQVAAVVGDMDVRAVKIGMLGGVATIEAVARALDIVPADVPVVVDPVMVAESGARLLDEDACEALVRLILPRAAVVTPNLPEARVLAAAGATIHDPTTAPGPATAPLVDETGEAEALARAIHALGPACVVVTGGHRTEVVDTVFDGTTVTRITGARHADGAAHGSGCTHASALAAYLAHGLTPVQAARRAKAVAAAAV
ncbi:MAG: phosphomethylpyrimidine kinase, partial [Solirubrobacterales bacterium]|nr:phosphomethylpyrimidine kinase [Solirubrobacterales bacterium]